MSFFRFGSGRHGFDEDPRNRRWFGGGDRFDGPGGRFGGPGGGRRDRQGGRRDGRGNRGGKSRGEPKKGGGERIVPKRKLPGSQGDPSAKKLKPGNNWHGIDRHPLMQPANMETKPENFEEEWMCIVRPPGRRRIVVAANNVTQSYNNAQDPDMKFESCLPSGNNEKDAMFKQQDLTVLDTIYRADKKEFYVVDMLHWRHYPYYETDADFRTFCLKDKWTQLQKPGERWSLNDYPLLLLEKHPCTKESIEDALKSLNDKVDDILFINKTSTYNPQGTPDCLKLKLQKLEEVLGIPVPEGVVISTSQVKSDKGTGESKAANESQSTETKNEDEGENVTEEKYQNSPDSAEEAGNDNENDEEMKEEDNEGDREEEEEDDSENDDDEQNNS